MKKLNLSNFSEWTTLVDIGLSDYTSRAHKIDKDRSVLAIFCGFDLVRISLYFRQLAGWWVLSFTCIETMAQLQKLIDLYERMDEDKIKELFFLLSPTDPSGFVFDLPNNDNRLNPYAQQRNQPIWLKGKLNEDLTTLPYPGWKPAFVKPQDPAYTYTYRKVLDRVRKKLHEKTDT